MERIVVYGKGGIGKSTIAANLSAVYGRAGKKVLHVGCDPKHDSSLLLIGRQRIRTVLEVLFARGNQPLTRDQIVMTGIHGIDCIESGGPEPGVGCGGRGVTRMFEILADLRLFETGGYDVVVFDVLGDVVCGGFAAPLRAGLARKIVIVTSEEAMSLFAANNICRAIRRHEANGASLVGLVANLRDSTADDSRVQAFAERIGTRVLSVFSRDPALRLAESRRLPIVDMAPGSPLALRFEALASSLLASGESGIGAACRPMDDETFDRFASEEA